MKTIYKLYIALSLLFAFSACQEDDYGKHTDIDYPIPTLEDIAPEQAIGKEITIKGANFISPVGISIDGIEMKVVSENETEIKAVLPRIFNAARIKVRNGYKTFCESKNEIRPIYPTTEINTWPAKIIRGRKLKIEGNNVDMITQITINDVKIAVNGLTQKPDAVSVLVPKNLAGTSAKIQIRTLSGSTLNSEELPITDPPATPAASILLLDFEDGITHFSGPGSDPHTAQINRDGISPIEGSKFFSLYVPNVSNHWADLGFITLAYTPATAIDLSEFIDPHLSFRYNSDDKIGNFQFCTTQGPWVLGSYFANNVTGNPLDRWTLRATNKEWQWVSAPLLKKSKDEPGLMTEIWGRGTGEFEGFDQYLPIDKIQLIFKQINGAYWDGTKYTDGVVVNKSFKINIDQIMITDGPMKDEEK